MMSFKKWMSVIGLALATTYSANGVAANVKCCYDAAGSVCYTGVNKADDCNDGELYSGKCCEDSPVTAYCGQTICSSNTTMAPAEGNALAIMSDPYTSPSDSDSDRWVQELLAEKSLP